MGGGLEVNKFRKRFRSQSGLTVLTVVCTAVLCRRCGRYWQYLSPQQDINSNTEYLIVLYFYIFIALSCTLSRRYVERLRSSNTILEIKISAHQVEPINFQESHNF